MKNKTYEEVKKTYKETWAAVEATSEYQDLNKALDVVDEAEKAVDEAWEVVEATPEWKDYKKAEDALREVAKVHDMRGKE